MDFFDDKYIFSIPHSISLIYSSLTDELRKELKKANLDMILPNYAPVFRILADYGDDMPLTMLAEKSQNSKPYVTQMVNILEKSGYMIRKNSPSDKRIVFISLTEKGYEAHKAITQIIHKITCSNFENCSKEELIILAILLNKISNVHR